MLALQVQVTGPMKTSQAGGDKPANPSPLME